MRIIIGSEGMGCWGNKIINYLLYKLNYKNIEYKNIDECAFIIASHFIDEEQLWNTKKKKYIYWSGESYIPENNKNQTTYIYILSTLESINNYIYIPYALISPHIYKKRKYTNLNREYLLAYCNSHKVKERELLFDIFVEKTNINLCHSYGACTGSYEQTKKNNISNDHDDEQLIDIYKNYTFVIAMENKCVDGYVTEKIINAFYSGAIPIYWGSSNITKFFNKNAFINVNDFETFEKCVEYVIKMDTEKIKQMTQEPIYQNNDLINLLNDVYNNKYDNKILNEYLNILNQFLIF